MKGKKIRGLRRREKAINKWFERNRVINFKILDKYHYYYAKAKIAPWANLFNHRPYPKGYRRMLFSMLLSLHSEWQKQLEGEGFVFRLEIWVFWPKFIESQVVVSIEEKREYYKDLFKPSQYQKPFPIELFNNETIREKDLSWKYSEDFDHLWEGYFEDDEKNRKFYKSLLRNNQYNVVINEEGKPERLFYIKRNDVWIGQNN